MNDRYSFTLYVFLLISIFSYTSCDEEADGSPIPPETHEGKNTFGCKVDGKVWIPTTNDFLGNPLSSDYVVSKKRFVVGASVDSDILQSISILVDNFTELPREYKLESPDKPIFTDSAFGVFRIFKPLPEKKFFTNNLKQGKLVITKIDSVERIASGRFEFEATDSLSGETVKITEGRFDVRYNRFK